MTNTLKRWGVALATTLAFVVSLLVPNVAQAAADNASLTITGLNTKASVAAYPLITYSDENYNSYTFNSTLKFDEYIESKNSTINTADGCITYLSGLTSSQLATLLQGYQDSYGDTLYANISLATTADESNGSASLTLTPGFYYILARSNGGGVTYNPTAVFVKVDGSSTQLYGGTMNDTDANLITNGTITMKSQSAPTVTAQISDDAKTWGNTTAAGVGDSIYTLTTVNVPILADGTMVISLSDVLTNAAYVNGTIEAYSDAACTTKIDAVSVTTSGYSASSNSETLTITLDTTKISGTSGTSVPVYIRFRATVRGNAATGHSATSALTMTYKNGENGNEYSTTANTVTAYNYGFQLNKVDGNSKALSGAQFQVFRSNSDTAEAIEFVKTSAADASVNTYRPAVSDVDTNTVTTLDGSFKIDGLDQASYYVKESKTPEGYTAPTGLFTTKLDGASTEAALTGELAQSSSFTATDTDKALVKSSSISGAVLTATLINTQLAQLPTTGGMGTVIFTVAGVALMAAAAVAYFYLRKKEQDK